MPAVSLWVEGRGRSRADHRPRAETMGGGGGTRAGDACDVGAGGRRQDLAMVRQLDLLARQAWGHARLASGCVAGGCANAQDRKKKESEKNNQKKKAKTDSPVQTPTKTPTSTGLACVVCVCVASVRAGREARGGGVCGDGIGRVFVGTL